jgi:hypothetical protein
MSARFVPTTDAHVTYVAERMRSCDVQEVWAASNHTPLESLRESVAITEKPETILVRGVPAAICGVSKIPGVPGIGVPWMLGTGAVETAPLAFGRLCREWIARKKAKWPVLVNYSDARCEKTHRWLEWLGFRLFDPTPFGVEGLMFRRFEMRN